MSFIYQFTLPTDAENEALPFDIRYNFHPLIVELKKMIESKAGMAQGYLELVEEIERKGVINRPFKDIDIIRENQEALSRILTPLFPDILTDNEIKGIILPFSKWMFHPSARMQKLMDAAGKPENIQFNGESNTDPYISACIFILNWVYDAAIDYGSLYYVDVTDAKTGLTRHFRTFNNVDFITMKRKPGTPELTEEDIEVLKNDLNNRKLWMEKMPPESYLFEGFGLLTLMDVTREQQESRLKNLLLKRDVLDSPVQIEQLTKLLRSYFQVNDLEIGLAAYQEESDMLRTLGFGLWKSILLDEGDEKCSADDLGTGVIDNLKSTLEDHFVNFDILQDESCEISRHLIQKNIGSYAIFPLHWEGKLIALVEMMSKEKNKLNKITARKFENIKGLLATSVNRYLNEYDTQLEAIIKEKCTAIHPAVEWKFRTVADDYLRMQLSGMPAEIEDIDFPGVHPLYGQIDIKDSSMKRNNAIREDILEQLDLIKEIIDMAYKHSRLPYYKQLDYRIKAIIEELSLGINVGDEVSVLDFINREIGEAFRQMEDIHEEVSVALKKYRKKLDTSLQVINKRRKRYEDSVNVVTRTITEMFSDRQKMAQEMFPHYYEKYKTDGVEHNIYIGESLVKNKKYSEVYLKNLRLWQLMSIIEVENRLKAKEDKLKVPLEVCSLVLVHNNPISIRFRMDEKKFDVEGAYNIRYEIIKKRIDKSLIQQTKERLTQPGKLAIIFSQNDEEQEYRAYLEFLESIGYIKAGIESHTLLPVQGINGLRALRVDINYGNEGIVDSGKRLMESVIDLD